jgi:subtilisin family serine protease
MVGTLIASQTGSSMVGAAANEPRSKFSPGALEALAKGEATVWVLMKDGANLGPAYTMKDAPRGSYVYKTLRDVAARSQAGLRAQLDQLGVNYKPFWILNALQVRGTEGLLMDIAARSDVKAILADVPFKIPPVEVGKQEPTAIDAIEWNIERVRANRVWDVFNDRGENIVVANVDTGVQFDHPADVSTYRGNLGGGSFDHNFNWFDPSNICGTPSTAPCDNVGHGTHTMGTMVGDDGGSNRIGVAPRAKWIACKGCETNSCSDFALLTCGQFILAPTDLAGNNANPSLRPHVVNNSWGGGPGDPFYQAVVDAWVASGIWTQFSNGNAGPSCGSAGSPGDYVNSYSAGAFSISNNIASFSSRGPSAFGGEIKPNIAAPGVSVRSSVPTNSYASFSGTSMASPHVAATVALIWSENPALARNIAATRAILDGSATDHSDLTCGGTAADNNVWGEGRLNAFEAVRSSVK